MWSPLPPSASGIADYVAEALPGLAARAQLQMVVERPEAVEPALRESYDVVSPETMASAELDLYHVGNSPDHAYVYRRALAEPGVVVLHEWSLHHLVLHETLEKGDAPSYLREMRRAHGETGTFVGRQVARALGGDILPALFPLNDRLLESSLAVVGLSSAVAEGAVARLPGRPVLHLPHHVALPGGPWPTRSAARRALGLPEDAFLVTAPGLAQPNKGLEAAFRAAARLRPTLPSLRVVVAGAARAGYQPLEVAAAQGLTQGVVHTGRLTFTEFIQHLCAADVVLSLRFPSHGEMSGSLLRALGVGRPVLVTAGTAAAAEFPEGVVIPIDPGPREDAEIAAFLAHLHTHPETAERISRAARAHVEAHHDLDATTARLADFLEQVAPIAAQGRLQVAGERAHEGGLAGYFMEEIRWGARDLGLGGLPLRVDALLRELLATRT